MSGGHGVARTTRTTRRDGAGGRAPGDAADGAAEPEAAIAAEPATDATPASDVTAPGPSAGAPGAKPGGVPSPDGADAQTADGPEGASSDVAAAASSSVPRVIVPSGRASEPARADEAVPMPDAPAEAPAEPAGDDPARRRTTIGAGQDAPGPDPRMRREPSAEPAPTTVPTASTPSRRAPEPAPARRGSGVLPLLLGGLAAGGIGFGAARLLEPAAVGPAGAVDTARIEAVEARVAAIEEAPAGTAEPVDLAPLRSGQEALSADLEALAGRVASVEAAGDAAPAVAPGDLEALAARIDEVVARLDGLEARVETVAGDATAARDAAEGNAGTLETLSGEVDGLVVRLDGIVSDLGSRVSSVEDGLSDARALATSVEDEAAALARDAARNQVRIALESGAPYEEPLAVLGDAPEGLAGPAAAGVPTQGELVADFPPLAREALRVARAETAGGGVGGLLSSAFGARSLEPREGSDPDAILSRVEAAARAGDLETALAEIGALPAPAQAALADWTERARTRLAARAAADDFLQDG